MRLLFICNEYPPEPFGGFGTFAKEITHHLAAFGHQVYVYGWYDSVRERTTYKEGEVTVIKDAKPKVGSTISVLKKFGKNVNKITKEYGIDVVEVNDTGALFLFINHKNLVVRLHNTERFFKKRSRVLTLLEKASFALKKAKIIAVSGFIKGEFEKYFNYIHPESVVSIVYNGVEILPVLSNKVQKTIVFGGTLKPVKGLDTLIKGFDTSKLWKEGFALHIYGKDIQHKGRSYAEQLKEIVDSSDSGLGQSVYFHGTVDKNQLMKEFSESYMNVIPSRLESFGLVVIESMLQEAITIFTNQGAAKEFIDNGKDGFLIPVGDYEKLSEILNKLAGMKEEELNEIRKRARVKAKDFSMKKCVQETLKIYQQ